MKSVKIIRTAVQFPRWIIIIDAELNFPEDELLEIDYVYQDYTLFCVETKIIKGLFITHGHEDHIGESLPITSVNIPIYGGKFKAMHSSK